MLSRSTAIAAVVLVNIACSFSGGPEGSASAGTRTASSDETTATEAGSSADTTSTDATSTSTTASSTDPATTDDATTESSESETTSGSETGSSDSETGTGTATETTEVETDSTTDALCGECEFPIEGLGCTDDCKIDFSEVPQWYCSGECAPTNPAPPGQGCTKDDADLFCQVLMRDPSAFAVGYQATFIEPVGGFCCLEGAARLAVVLGPFDDLGIEEICYQPTDLTENHGVGIGILASNLECDV